MLTLVGVEFRAFGVGFTELPLASLAKLCYNNPNKTNFLYLTNTMEAHMTSITKDSVIGQILDANRATAKFFLDMGMHCLGCPSARDETVEQACAVHGVDADKLVADINEFLAAQ